MNGPNLHLALIVVLLIAMSVEIADAAVETPDDDVVESRNAAQAALLAGEAALTAAERSHSTVCRAREASRIALLIGNKKDSRSIACDAGTCYGHVRNGEPHGHGVFCFHGGSRYEGEFVDGLFHGHGLLHVLDNDQWHVERHEGEFRGRAFETYGIHTCNDESN